jgi:RND family efflux transporter MFP subunit
MSRQFNNGEQPNRIHAAPRVGVTAGRPRLRLSGLVGTLLWAECLFLLHPASGGEIDGFTEPYRSINVASTEIGIIAELKVQEGDVVKKGQTVAVLDNEVQTACLSIAQKHIELKGRLASARAELELRRNRLEKLEELASKGHARREEIERGRADVAIAEAQAVVVEEELAVRKLEYQKVAVDLKRRNVTAPMNGVVAHLHKQNGEFVAPTDPQILNLVQLDRLFGVFSLPAAQAILLHLGDRLPVRLGDSTETAEGIVESVSPLTDAESGTIRIKVRIENPQSRYQSGQRCTMLLRDPPPLKQAAAAPPAAARRSDTRVPPGTVSQAAPPASPKK